MVGLGAWYGYRSHVKKSTLVAPDDLIVSEVVQGPFDHTIVEQGEIESSSNTEVICEIKSRNNAGTSILWVIDEGTAVKEGDKLVELDSADLELGLKENRIEVITAEASVATASALLEQATISRQEYLEGIFLTEEKAILSEIAIAEQELRKSQLALQSSERLVAKGLVNALQLDADKFALANTRNQLDAAQGRLKVLQNLTKRKMLVQYDSDIEAAKAGLAAAREKLSEEQNELADVQAQIESCVMLAPTDGIVVHANKQSNRGGGSEFVVEAGAIVRERQTLIRLPNPAKMQVKCNVNESRITLLKKGMAAKIRIDALPSVTLKGHVAKVNRYAEPGSWFSSSIKEYAVVVEIVEPPEVIRTGMTASVEVFIQQLPEATQVPIQAVYEHDKKMFALVQKGKQTFETRQVKIAAINDTMASITEGLEPGDKAVLNLREHLSLMDLPEVVVEDNSDMAAIPQVPGAVAALDAEEVTITETSATPEPIGDDAAPGPGGESRNPSESRKPGAEGRPLGADTSVTSEQPAA
jgi:RND family efflux transporter MFP subunit